MAEPILLPKMGLTMEEGTVDEWLVALGGEVTRGAPVVAISTYKAEMEVESPADGTLIAAVEAGETCAAGAVIGVVGEPGEDPSAYRLREPLSGGPTAVAEPPARPVAPVPTPERVRSPEPARAGTTSASPAVRRRAHELGVDLADVEASDGGRLRIEDVERAAQ